VSLVPDRAAKLAAGIPNLLQSFDEGLGDDFSHPAMLLSLEADDDGVTVSTRQLAPGQHPLDELLGLVAPDEWDAIGTICHGWASRYLSQRPSRAPDRFRVRSFHVVGRDGVEVGAFRADGGRFSFEEATVGTVPDALRRCLNLPTPSPESSPAELAAADWLDALADDATAEPPMPAGTWEELRWQVIARTRIVPNLTPTLAAWMDEGMFARWMAGTYPRTADQLAAVRRVVNGRVYRRVRATLRGWALPV
jgi:hypothetical protein